MAKQYKCSNYGICPEADKETIFQETDLEEVDGKYICPKCGQELEVIEKGGAGKGKLIGIIAAAAVVLGGGVTALILGGGKKEKPEVVTEQPAGETTDVDKPVVEEPKEEPAPAEPRKPAPTPAPKPASTTYNLGWGTYEGPMQGGKPHGMGGEIKVTKDFQIDMKNGSFKNVSRGDKIVNCKFSGGKLVQGFIHHANGQQESLYIGN